MSKVIIRNAAYDYKTLKPAFFEVFDAIAGGMVKKGSRDGKTIFLSDLKKQVATE